MRRRPEVVVFTRSGCGLCERAERLVAREAKRASVRTVDVDTDPRLADEYGLRIPVVTVDGVEVASFELAPRVVRAAVRAARRHALGRHAPGQ